jgi:hypothetical protein
MLNLVEQPGFDYGYPKPSPKLGLWCPLFDCFLMVGHDYNILSDVQLLTSSKIITILIQLNLPATESNIIDNEVCSSWTLLDSESINFTFVFKKINDVPTSEIQPKLVVDLEEVNKLQVWFIFVNNWVTHLSHRSNSNRAIKFIDFVMGNPTPDQVKQQIYKILLLEDSINIANNQINQLL